MSGGDFDFFSGINATTAEEEKNYAGTKRVGRLVSTHNNHSSLSPSLIHGPVLVGSTDMLHDAMPIRIRRHNINLMDPQTHPSA